MRLREFARVLTGDEVRCVTHGPMRFGADACEWQCAGWDGEGHPAVTVTIEQFERGAIPPGASR
ncbi:MAG: hypothetical protein M3Y33_20795 [Actinomycetota bacterium]|nr:hypothetical protein [Actinomycetota bacterium]